MHLICPQCRHPIVLAALNRGAEVLCPACGSTVHLIDSSLTTLHVARPTRLGRFELVEPLGEGAFGTVWRARDSDLRREVALKVPRGAQSPDEAERFLREARAAAQLRHPAIVSVHEVGQHDGTPYLVSDLVEGVTLADLLTGRRPTFDEAARWVAVIAEALHFAHERGIVHRDVKPSNIMITTDGAPMVMDFGLAKRESGEGTMTHDGQVLGTPAFMSPEQAAGHAHHVDRRSDVYSLGVVLYRLLTGDLPYRGNIRMLLHQVLHDEPRSPRSLNDRVPRDLETVCLKAMAKEPARRYATAQELADDLRRWLAGEPVRARPTSQLERGWRWCRRNPVVAGLATTLVGVLMLVAISSTAVAIRMSRLAASEQEAREDALERAEGERNARFDATSKSQELQRALSRQYVARGERALDASDYSLAMLWFAEALELDRDDAERTAMHQLRLTNTWRQMPRLVGVFAHDQPLHDGELSPDGTRVVTASYDGTARVWDIATGRPVGKPLRHDGHVYRARFSPDGKLVATAGADATVRLWDAATGEPVGRPFEHGFPVHEIRFSPDGKKVAAVSAHPASYWAPPAGIESFRTRKPYDPTKPFAAIWDVVTGECVRLPGERFGQLDVVFSQDGKQVALTGPITWQAMVCDTSTGKRLAGPFEHPADKTEGYVVKVALSRDGSRLATIGYTGDLRLWDVREKRLIVGPVPAGGEPSFSRDGTRLVAGTAVRDAVTGREVRALPANEGMPTATSWGAEGGRVVLSRGSEKRVWDPMTGESLSPVLLGDTSTPCLGGRGRFVFTPGQDGIARLYDLAGAARHPPIAHEGKTWAYSWSLDHRWLFTSGSTDNLVWKRDPVTGKTVGPPLEHMVRATDIEPHPDGKHLWTASIDGLVRKWNLATGDRVGTPLVHKQQLKNVFYSYGTKDLVTLTDEKNLSRAYVWDHQHGSLRWMSPPGKMEVSPWAANHDRRLAAFVVDVNDIQVIDFATGKTVASGMKHTYWIGGFAFTPDDRTLASGGGDRMTRVWNLGTSRERFRLQHQNQVTKLAYSPDGRWLATGERSGTVRVWHAADGRAAGPALSLGGPIVALGFSPDSRYLAGATKEVTQVWDVFTGERMGPALRQRGDNVRVDFRKDGKQLVVGGVETGLLVDFTAQARSVADWSLLARVQSGRQIDETGTVVPLELDEMRAAWKQYAERFATEVHPTRDQVRAWHWHDIRRLQQARRPIDVREGVEALLTEFPDDLDALHLRASLARDAGQYVRATADFTKVAESRPWVWLSLVPVHAKAGTFEEGVQDLSERISRDSRNRHLWWTRGRLHLLARRWQAAIDDLTRAVDEGARGAVFSQRGYAFAEMGRWQEARRDYERAFDEEPGMWHHVGEQAMVLLALEDRSAFKAMLLGPLSLNQWRHHSSLYVRNQIAWMHVLYKPFWNGECWTSIVSALEGQPNNRDYLNTMALTHYRFGNVKQAIEAAQKAIAADGKGEPVDWLILGMSYVRLKQPEEAIRWLEKARAWMNRPESEWRLDNGVPLGWVGRLDLWLLLREADALVRQLPHPRWHD